jgi:predicted AAA+ superfamily ATPase
MNRIAYSKMEAWKLQKARKPLILRGARQVGKTWLMQEFARNEFAQSVYINFESNRSMRDVLEASLDPNQIIRAIQIETGIQINPADTVLIFDEIQACPAALTSLKYFQEQMPALAILTAGSLLGVALHTMQSFPVGKVDFLDIHPLNFEEFLMANQQNALKKQIDSQDWAFIKTIKHKYIEQLKTYYFVGGMPEAVQTYLETHDLHLVRAAQHRLIQSYEQDFSKHAPYREVPRIRLIWESITSQLAKENSKFIYGVLRAGARAKDFELGLRWLADAGLIHMIPRISKPNIPLSAYADLSDFKIYLHDVGLLTAMGQIDIQTYLQGNIIFQEFKGALTEQYVCQQLISMNIKPYYWTIEKSIAEVDFVCQIANGVIPIEVKAELNVKAKSLKIYQTKFNPVKSLRISMADFNDQNGLTDIPLYAISQINSLAN